MAKERAEVEIKLSGTDSALSEVRKLDSQLSSLGSGAASTFRRAGGALLEVAGGALKAGAALQGISLVAAIEESKRLDLATARLGQTAGVAGSRLQATFDSAEKKTLTSSLAQADFARQLARSTYDGGFAADSVSALADSALALGRDLGDELPLGVALHNLGVEAKDLPAELGRIRSIAESLKSVGGPAALKDTLAALGPQLDQVATASDESRARLEALVGLLGKGLKPQQAQAVASQALGLVQSRGLDLERLTGRQIFDEKGQMVDPTQALADYQKIVRRKWGSNTAGMRRALVDKLGPALGSLMASTDFSDVAEISKLQGTGATEAEAEKFRKSKEGQRQAAELEKQQALRAAGKPFLGIGDWMLENLGVGGSMLASAAGVKALEAGGGALLAKGGGATGLGFSLGGLGLVGLSAGSLAFQLKALSEIGEDRDTMGARWRSERAGTIGKELAGQAERAGDLRSVIGRADGDKDAIKAMLEILESRFDRLDDTLKTQVAAGIAAELKRSPMRVTVQANPNAPRGN